MPHHVTSSSRLSHSLSFIIFFLIIFFVFVVVVLHGRRRRWALDLKGHCPAIGLPISAVLSDNYPIT
jgi:hypothetical protein